MFFLLHPRSESCKVMSLSGDLELEGACLESYCPPEFESLNYTMWSEEELSNLTAEDLQWWKNFCGDDLSLNLTLGTHTPNGVEAL